MLGLVQLQRPTDAVHHPLRRPGRSTAFEARVVLHAHPGEKSDLVPAQPGDTAAAAEVRQPGLLRSEPGPTRDQELPELAAIVHVDDGTTPASPEGVPVRNPTDRDCLRSPIRRRLSSPRNEEAADMADTKVWFITGAARGLAVDLVKAALASGHSVVATARNAQKVTEAIGEHERLLPVALDITDPAASEAAAAAAVERFGRIDVLVNNAGNFYAEYFESISPEQFRAQMETNFFGPLNVTRAVLPGMRQQRSGQVITITSTAGLIGQEFCAAYAASKFALEGWMESLRYDLAPYGITTMAVEPGFFRTELLVEGASTIWPELRIDDYAERTEQTTEAWKSMNGQQGGDPAKLAQALVTLSDSADLPLRFVAGADAMGAVEQNLATIQRQIDDHRDLSASLSYSA
jgi:NAD(P)-dependent dehydrogenase (short-subunit alcohol dehydrogenase family)